MISQRSHDHVKDDRTAMLVLGMHRSGTSAFARVVSLLGADLPTTLLPPRSDNRRGFWESAELATLHDEILASAGTTWHDWTRFNPDWYKSPLAPHYREKLLAYLVKDFGTSAFFVIKDPRMCRLIGLWRETLEKFGASIKLVIPVRNPLEVAQSLRHRDGFIPAKSHLLWLRHTLAAIQDSKGVARCVVSYDALLRDWRDATTTMSRRLQVNWPRYSPSVEAEIDAFLAHEERHHVVEDDVALGHPALCEWVKRAYRTLLTMADSDDAPSAQADVDDLLHQLDEASDAFGPLLMEQEKAVTALQASKDLLAHDREEQRRTLEELTAHDREEQRRTLEELTEAQGRFAQASEEKRQWEARAEHARAQLGEAARRLEGTERRLGVWQEHTRALSTELAALRHRRVLRVLERFRPGPDLSQQISPTFQNLLDDSYLFLGDVTGYRLQPSEDLQTLGGRMYTLRLDRPNLSGLMLAPIVDLPDGSGSLGIDLSTPDGVRVASARVSLTEIEQHRPVRFVFPPVQLSVGHIVLRVDVRDTTIPIRLFEWRKRRFFGLGRLATRPFCAFMFD